MLSLYLREGLALVALLVAFGLWSILGQALLGPHVSAETVRYGIVMMEGQ